MVTSVKMKLRIQELLSGANGRRTDTSVPPPGALAIVSVPPERVMISSHTARPMPLPRALCFSPLKNFSFTCGSSFSGMPGPWSLN